MPKLVLKKEPNLTSKHDAFVYQSQAVEALKDKVYGAVFHEQGLGKTKIAIDIMLYWLEHKLIDTILLVTKKSLINNWERELASHTYIKPKLLTQNGAANFHAFNSPSRVILTHYEVLRSEKSRFLLFLKARDVAIILDESAKIKNPDSEITKVLFQLSGLFKKRFIMTGTPVANRPFDIWAQIKFLDSGVSLGDDFNTFKKNTDLSNDLCTDKLRQKDFENTIEDIYRKISSFAVRQTKSGGVIILPDKIVKRIYTDWETHQYDLYRQVRDEMRVVVLREGIPTEDKSQDLLKRILRLVQIASNPGLVDSGYHAEPGKLEFLRDIVHNVCSHGEKCIIWSAFTENVDWLARELASYGTCRVHGKLSIDRRNGALQSFMHDEDRRVLVATPSSAKEGLTLTVANHVIFYDRTFSLDDYLQAQDRIHRISQSRTCYVHNLIMPESIDEWIDILLQSKHLAAQLAQGDISLEYYRTSMTYEFGTIIKEILGIGNSVQ
jgi:SNF2 family DNA or RNA helicase